MSRSLLLTACLLLSASVAAEWHMTTDGFSHSVVTRNADGHQLVVDASGKAASLIVDLAGSGERSPTRWAVEVRVDGKPVLAGELAFLNEPGKAGSASLLLDDDQKITLLHQMVAGLQLVMTSKDPAARVMPLSFSLIGFTAALNDLLIANHVGKLDFDWLLETHREQELICLYAATMTVRAMDARISGQSQAQTLAGIRATGIDMLDDGVPALVDSVYRVPATQLPHEPSAEKYGIFQACLRR